MRILSIGFEASRESVNIPGVCDVYNILNIGVWIYENGAYSYKCIFELDDRGECVMLQKCVDCILGLEFDDVKDDDGNDIFLSRCRDLGICVGVCL